MNERADHCLICYSLVAPLSPIEDRSFENNDFTYNTATTDTLISKQAQTIFVLRNLLEIPTRQLEDILRKWADVGPEMWIKLCDHCRPAVDQAMVIYKDLLKIKWKFSEAQKGILNRIVHSGWKSAHDSKVGSRLRTLNKGTRKKPGRKDGKLENAQVKAITEECREFVTNRYCTSSEDQSVNYFADCTSLKNLTKEKQVTVSTRTRVSVKDAVKMKVEGKLQQDKAPHLSLEIKREPDDGEPELQAGTLTNYSMNSGETDIEDGDIPMDFQDEDDHISISKYEETEEGDVDWAPLTSREDAPIIPRKTKKKLKTPKKMSSKGKVKRKPAKKSTSKVCQSEEVVRKRRPPKDKISKERNPGHRLCEICAVLVPYSDIVEHIKAHVGEEYLIKCPNPNGCYFACFYYVSLNRHLNTSQRCLTSISEAQKQEFFNPQFICETCECHCSTVVALRHHILRYHENTPKKLYPCPVENCNKKFSVRQSVVVHLRAHLRRSKMFSSPSNVQECSHCFEKVSMTEIEAHLKEVHAAMKVIKCTHCSFMFDSTELLVEHLHVHRNEGSFCHICGEQKKFSWYNKLCEHYLKVHQVGKKIHCKLCPATFLFETGLKLHEQRKHKNNKQSVSQESKKKSFQCDECDDVTFLSKLSLDAHKIRLHGAEPFKCKLCEERFNSFNLLIRHERAHEGVSYEEDFPCEVAGCGENFNTRVQLKMHLSIKHDIGNSHICDVCGKGFPYEFRLIDHRNKKHLNLRPHVCHTCGESFLEPHCLRNHMLIHSGDRPFVCELCGQRFRQREVLQRHRLAHQVKGSNFKPKGSMKQIRKRAVRKCPEQGVENSLEINGVGQDFQFGKLEPGADETIYLNSL